MPGKTTLSKEYKSSSKETDIDVHFWFIRSTSGTLRYCLPLFSLLDLLLGSLHFLLGVNVLHAFLLHSLEAFRNALLQSPNLIIVLLLPPLKESRIILRLMRFPCA